MIIGSQLVAFEWKFMSFVLQPEESSSVLIRVMKLTRTRPDALASQLPARGWQFPPTEVPRATRPFHLSVIVHMNELLANSPSLERHLNSICKVLANLCQENLYLKASKCEFCRHELGLVGHLVLAVGVAVYLQKVAVVRDWPVPTSSVDLYRSVGLCIASFIACF